MKCEPDSIGRVKNGPVPSKKRLFIKKDALVKNPKNVMPNLIRHPEHIEIAGFRLSPE